MKRLLLGLFLKNNNENDLTTVRQIKKILIRIKISLTLLEEQELRIVLNWGYLDIDINSTSIKCENYKVNKLICENYFNVIVGLVTARRTFH